MEIALFLGRTYQAMNSVCLASYNGEKYIEEQLRSILCQLRAEDEVIVSDDDSTDRTVEIVERIGDRRIRVLHSHCHSVRRNFEQAMQAARGEIIFLSDQDDVWLPGKYERCVAELAEADLVCTNSMLTDECLQVQNDNFFSLYHSGAGILKNTLNNTYYGSCMAFRRRLLSIALPLPKSQEVGHDVWLGLVAEMVGTVRFIDTPYLLYRRHSGTSTQTDTLWCRSRRPLWKKVWGRMVILYYVCIFQIKHRYAR